MLLTMSYNKLYIVVMEEKFYSVSQVAQLLGVSEETVRRAIRAGKLKARMSGREFEIREWDLQTYGLTGAGPAFEPSNLTQLSMGYEGAWPAAILFDEYFFGLEVQYQRMQEDISNRDAGIAKQQLELKERLAKGIPGAPPPYWSLPNKTLFLDIKLYFVVAENLRKTVEETFRSISNKDFQNLVAKHSDLFRTVKKLRGMLEHLADQQVSNPKIGGDLGNIYNGKFTFGNKEYDYDIDEFRKLRDELSDFFILNNYR